MGFAGIDADAPTQIVLQEAVAAGGKQARAGVRGVREVVLLDQVVVGFVEHAGVPDAVGLVLAERGMIDVLEDDAAVMRLLAPAGLGIVVVVGEVAILDQPLAAVLDLQPDAEALDVEVLERHAGDAVGGHAVAGVVLGIALRGADHPGPAAVNGDIRALDDDRAVGRRRVQHRVGGDHQRLDCRGLGVGQGGRHAQGARCHRTPTSAKREYATSSGQKTWQSWRGSPRWGGQAAGGTAADRSRRRLAAEGLPPAFRYRGGGGGGGNGAGR